MTANVKSAKLGSPGSGSLTVTNLQSASPSMRARWGCLHAAAPCRNAQGRVGRLECSCPSGLPFPCDLVHRSIRFCAPVSVDRQISLRLGREESVCSQQVPRGSVPLCKSGGTGTASPARRTAFMPLVRHADAVAADFGCYPPPGFPELLAFRPDISSALRFSRRQASTFHAQWLAVRSDIAALWRTFPHDRV